MEKEQAADSIMRGLNKQYTLLADKVCLPEERQSVYGTLVSLRGLLGRAP